MDMDLEKFLFFTMLSGAFIWTFYKLYKMDEEIGRKDDKSS